MKVGHHILNGVYARVLRWPGRPAFAYVPSTRCRAEVGRVVRDGQEIAEPPGPLGPRPVALDEATRRLWGRCRSLPKSGHDDGSVEAVERRILHMEGDPDFYHRLFDPAEGFECRLPEHTGTTATATLDPTVSPGPRCRLPRSLRFIHGQPQCAVTGRREIEDPTWAEVETAIHELTPRLPRAWFCLTDDRGGDSVKACRSPFWWLVWKERYPRLPPSRLSRENLMAAYRDGDRDLKIGFTDLLGEWRVRGGELLQTDTVIAIFRDFFRGSATAPGIVWHRWPEEAQSSTGGEAR